MMFGAHLFKIFSLFSVFAGIGILMSGANTMYDSGYRPPETPIGWIFGIFWITISGTIGWTWSMYILSELLIQKYTHRKRWSFAHIISTSMFLLAAMSLALVGIWLTWKYPYKLGPCDCTEEQWGPLCTPCQCDLTHGVCDWGVYGTGVCSCDPQWASNCSVCAERWKPEPSPTSTGACNVCKTGYAGENCENCAKGYTGDDCSVCDDRWQPWYHTSSLFPDNIAKDGRHICDECLPNHFGYYCTRCPYGTDVPLKTVGKNYPLTNGTMIRTASGYGTILSLVTDNIDGLLQLEKTSKIIRVQLKDIQSVKCNNRGTCLDDTAKLAANQGYKDNGFCRDDVTKEQSECGDWVLGKYPWEAICTSTGQTCSSHSDCLKSENCRGRCRGIDFPIDSTWYAAFNGNACEKNEDCQSDKYAGGRCMDTVCCEESHHGSGQCQCDQHFFGELLGENKLEHYQMSPACDFCPGYDWITEEPKTICSGNKGICAPSYARISLTGKGGEYQKMRCDCGEEEFQDPITKIVYPDKMIVWSGDLCQCGDWNEDKQCDICADGFWGPDCKTCPGGSGDNQCSRHGKCNAGVTGDGHCNCDVSEDNAWMLAPFIKRYPDEVEHADQDGNTATCVECAPQYWGDTCQKCNGMEKGDGGGRLPMSQLADVFQPSVSKIQSSEDPQSICNRGFCYIACSRGGWCNWGRHGDGKCSCWSNSVQDSSTWNPLDNVCIGNNRSSTNKEKGTEACASYGRCEGSNNARTAEKICGGDDQWLNKIKDFNAVSWNRNPYIQSSELWSPYDDWQKQGSGDNMFDYNKQCLNAGHGDTCLKWQPISWTKTKSLRTCREQ